MIEQKSGALEIHTFVYPVSHLEWYNQQCHAWRVKEQLHVLITLQTKYFLGDYVTRKKGSLAIRSVPKHLAIKLGPDNVEKLCKKFGYTHIRKNQNCPKCGSWNVIYRPGSFDSLCIVCRAAFAKQRWIMQNRSAKQPEWIPLNAIKCHYV